MEKANVSSSNSFSVTEVFVEEEEKLDRQEISPLSRIQSTESLGDSEDDPFPLLSRERTCSVADYIESVQTFVVKTAAKPKLVWNTVEGREPKGKEEVSPRSKTPESARKVKLGSPEIEKSKSFSVAMRKKSESAKSMKAEKELERSKKLKRSLSERFMHSWDYARHRKEIKVPVEEEEPVTLISIARSLKENNNNKLVPPTENTQRTSLNSKEVSWLEFLNGDITRKRTESIDSNDSSSQDDSSEELSWGHYLLELEQREQVIYNIPSDRPGKKSIKQASIEFLICSFISDQYRDDDYVDSFLLTYPIFMTSIDLLNKFIQLYNTTIELPDDRKRAKRMKMQEAQRKFNIIFVIRKWILFNDFKDDGQLVKTLLSFVDSLFASNNKVERGWAAFLKDALGVKQSDSPQLVRKTPKLHGIHLLKKVDIKTITFVDLDPYEFARHLTAVEWKLFKRIKPSELIKKAWSFPDKDKQSPNLVKLINNFNQMSSWIASEILTTANPKMRVKVLERFIEMMKGLRNLQNFHGLFLVFSALNMHSIQSLTTAWESVSHKHLTIVREVENLVDTKHHFRNYRAAIRKATPPMIPFEGIFMSDITFIEENPDMIGELVNWEKMDMLGKILSLFKRVQASRYKLTENALLNEFIKRSIVLNDEELYKLSKSINATERHRLSLGSWGEHRQRGISRFSLKVL